MTSSQVFYFHIRKWTKEIKGRSDDGRDGRERKGGRNEERNHERLKLFYAYGKVNSISKNTEIN